jgi:hypothetical protein
VHAARNMNVDTVAFICAILPMTEWPALDQNSTGARMKGRARTARSAAPPVQTRLAAIPAQLLLFRFDVRRIAATLAWQWRRLGCRPLRSR